MRQIPAVVGTATLEVTTKRLMLRRTFAIQLSPTSLIASRGICCLRNGFVHLTEEVSVEELMLEYVESVRRRPEEQRLTFFLVERDFQVLKILQSRLLYF